MAVVSLGFVTPAKCIDQIIRALSEIRSESPPFKFWIFGEMRHPATVRNAIKRYGMEDIVIEKGYTSMSSFEAAIEASDLVINLRYPTVGEPSGTMTRAMGAGKPVVVFRHGSFSEPPNDAVVGVPLDTFDHGNWRTPVKDFCPIGISENLSGCEQVTGRREWARTKFQVPIRIHQSVLLQVRETGQMNIVIHIGINKTGTSSLQFACSENHETLSASGILYPKIGQGYSAHHGVAFEIHRDEKKNRPGDRWGRWTPAGWTA